MACSSCGRKYPRPTVNGSRQLGPQPVAPYVNPNRRISIHGVVRAPVKQISPESIAPPKTS